MQIHFSFSGKCGDQVTWSSQAGGNTAVKTGTIIEVVPSGAKPKTRVKDAGSPRDHESYVVAASHTDKSGRTRKANYWPLVKNLQLSNAQSAAPAPLPPQPPPAPAKKLVNHFVICLDRSGSMQPIQRQAVETFNQNVRSIRDGAARSGQDATISLVTFGGDIRTPHLCAPVMGLPEFNLYDYRPDGNTPLFDAVGVTIEALERRPDATEEHVSFMFIIITDGEENASRQFGSQNFNQLIAKVQKTDRWSFAFLLPPGSGRNFCRNFGIPDGNVKEWDATPAGMAIAAQSVNAGINSYYTSRSAGHRSVTGFFVTDMTKVSAGEVRARLTDIRNQVKIAEVNRTVMIRDFVEKDLRLPYSVGRAFYQLMKDEKVQYHKKVILRERGTDAVYAGTEARHLLGLPDSLDVKVRPGDHANWDVFVQSTSVNRKLVPGTKLLYLS